MPPLISVVIPVYDAEDVLPRQLAGLAGQDDGGPWELVVADNGSTDGTPAVVEAFAAAHPELEVRLVDASGRRGAGAARNVGVDAARGEWLAFCDADDVVSPGWLRVLRDGLAEHDVVAGSYSTAGLNPEWLRRSRPLDQETALQPGPCSPFLPHVGAGNVAMPRALFLSVGGFDPDCLFLEDTDLSWRLQLFAGAHPVLRPQALVAMQLRGRFRDMAVQGFSYGVATAWLRARYALIPPAPPAPGEVSEPIRAWWRPEPPYDRGAAGFVLWQLAWRVGNRLGRLLLRARRSLPAPLPGPAPGPGSAPGPEVVR